MKRSIRLTLLTSLSLIAAVVSISQASSIGPTGSTEPPPPGKIARWVIDQTSGGAPAEFLVVLADQADLSSADQLSTKADKGRFVYDTLWAKAQSTQKLLRAWLEAQHVEYRSFYIVNAIWVKGQRDLAQTLAARSDVARIEGNPAIQNTLLLPAAQQLRQPNAIDSVEPNISYSHAPDVWALGFTGQGIVVGGQDTGYQWDHPALITQYRGWDGITVTHDYNWHDSIYTNTHGTNSCGVSSPVPCDDYGHGTHTMGTAVGSDGGSNQIGMAPGAKWIGCRNMDNGWGSPASYLECFQFFLAPYPVTGTVEMGDPSKAPDVTTNSWSCPAAEGCAWDTLQAALEAQRAAGIMTVVAATNSGPACSTIQDPPSLYAAAYSIGALNTGSDSIASFSSRGPVTIDGSNRLKPDLAAPGTGVRSSEPGNTYGSMSGTSMATPNVAGAIALLWSARPSLKNQITATEETLNNSAVHIATNACSSNGWPNNVYGYGRLDIKAAVDGLRVTPTASAQSTDPGGIVTYTLFITNTDFATTTLSLTGSGNLWITTIAPTSTDFMGPGYATAVTVTVAVPPDASALMSDTASINIASQSSGRAVTATLTTIVTAIHSATLEPASSSLTDHTGAAVTYTLRLTNTGNLTDSFTIASTSTWTVTLVPTMTALLNIGAGADITATINIPLTTTAVVSDVATIAIRAQSQPAIIATSILTTGGVPYIYYWPIFLKDATLEP